MKVVAVTWRDASGYGRWNTRKQHESHQCTRIRTIGHLLKSNREKVVVALSLDVDGDASDVLNIPRGCVERIEVLTTLASRLTRDKSKK